MRAVAFPDAEYLATRALEADEGLHAAVGTDLVGWTAGTPRLVVQRIGGTPRIPFRLDYARLDVDCYAASKQDAHDLAQLARVTIHSLPDIDNTDIGAVVCHVVDEMGLQWLPDPPTAAPRYVFTVGISIRPHP